MGYVYTTSFLMEAGVFTYISAWAFCVVRSLGRAMRRPESLNGQQVRDPRLFVSINIHKNLSEGQTKPNTEKACTSARHYKRYSANKAAPSLGLPTNCVARAPTYTNYFKRKVWILFWSTVSPRFCSTTFSKRCRKTTKQANTSHK